MPKLFTISSQQNNYSMTRKILKILPIIIIPAALLCLGAMNILSALKSGYSDTTERELYVQLVSIFLGITGAAIIIFFPKSIKIDRNICIAADVLSCAVLVLTVFIGQGNGNVSWIKIATINGSPIYLQFSEIAKIIFIYTLACHLEKIKDNINSPKELLFLLLHALFYVVCVAFQGDVGTASVYFFVFVLLCFIAGIDKKYFLITGAVSLASLPLLWKLLGENRRRRILIGFNPSLDPYGLGWQSVMSQRAVSNGGLFGVGFSNADFANVIPAALTDLPLSRISEEYGIVFAVAVIVILSSLVICLLLTSKSQNNLKSKIIIAGVAFWILIQTAENVGMTFGALPIVGIPLPFISCGGSSTLAILLALGFVIREVEK